ncbi:hypothetical protein BH09PAT2_BH09PAT2_08350 [soil metagenome]
MKEVRDSIMLLPNHEYRIILETSSINFELKSDGEQDVLIDAFQNFLNSLPCQIQILIRVREVDIDHYLEGIAQTKTQEDIPVYKDQIDNYCTFIKDMVSGNKILSRKFYIVVSYQQTDKSRDFSMVTEHMHVKRDIIIRGLEKLRMRARQLDSLEILELFYSFYNPKQAKIQQLKGQTIEALLQNNYV